MRNYLFAAILIMVVPPPLLYLYTKMSPAHPVAIAAIDNDFAVISELGPPRRVVLIGFSFRGSGAWGCTSLIYYVIGQKQNRAVNIRLDRRKPENWKVIELSTGFDTPFRVPCEYKS